MIKGKVKKKKKKHIIWVNYLGRCKYNEASMKLIASLMHVKRENKCEKCWS